MRSAKVLAAVAVCSISLLPAQGVVSIRIDRQQVVLESTETNPSGSSSYRNTVTLPQGGSFVVATSCSGQGGDGASLDYAITFDQPPMLQGESIRYGAGVQSARATSPGAYQFGPTVFPGGFGAPPYSAYCFLNYQVEQGGLRYEFSNRCQASGSVVNPGIAPALGFVNADLPFLLAPGTSVTIDATYCWGQQGICQEVPCLGDGDGGFSGGLSGLWFDPPLAVAYDFVQNGASRFTDVLSFPVGIDADGMFGVEVGGVEIGTFAEGARCDFVQVLGAGVAAFRVTGIDPKPADDFTAFPIQLAFDTPTASFTMQPVVVREIGAACEATPGCGAGCSALSLGTTSMPTLGNASFGARFENATAGSAGLVLLGIGPVRRTPFACDVVYNPAPAVLGPVMLGGVAACDGAGTLPLPLPLVPALEGLVVTLQGITACAGGAALTQGLEFALGT